MRAVRFTTLMAAAAVLALQLTPALSRQASEPPAAQAETEVMELHTVSKPAGDTHINVGKKGLSPGDYDVYQDPVMDRETGEKIGTVAGTITVLRFLGKEDVLLQGEFSYSLPNGSIQVNGAATFSAIFADGATLPITGGTGDYAGAGGWVLYQAADVGDTEGTFDTVHLILP